MTSSTSTRGLVDVTKHFNGALTTAVDGLSLEVATGEVVALVGPSRPPRSR